MSYNCKIRSTSFKILTTIEINACFPFSDMRQTSWCFPKSIKVNWRGPNGTLKVPDWDPTADVENGKKTVQQAPITTTIKLIPDLRLLRMRRRMGPRNMDPSGFCSLCNWFWGSLFEPDFLYTCVLHALHMEKRKRNEVQGLLDYF